MAIALGPIGVPMDGVIIAEGVPEGVFIDGVAPEGVAEGVAAPPGVAPPGVADGVSSHLERLLLALGVGVSLIIFSPGPRSALGVSAHPAPCPGVSRSVLGVSSQRFRLPGVNAAPAAGVSLPLPGCPGVTCAGVGSHILGVPMTPAPGVSDPRSLCPGVASQGCKWAGVVAVCSEAAEE